MNQHSRSGFAFPSPEWSDAHGNTAPQEYGMTLRDYFAAKAMQAAIAAKNDEPMRGYESWREEFAREAYRYADAMLKAREQQ